MLSGEASGLAGKGKQERQSLAKTTLPEDVTFVFDMDALNFS
jgi:hypothetical protein